MLKALKILFSLSCAVLLTACSDNSPFLSKEEATRLADKINQERDPFYAVKNIVAIIDNDIYYFDGLYSTPRKLTNTPSQQKTFVKLSSDRSKIAYINAVGNPVIISATNGQILETLTQYNYITQMDWVRNSATLFMLIGQEVVLHGAAISFDQPFISHPWDDVFSFSMNSVGDQAYAIQRYNDYGKKFEFQSSNDSQLYTMFNGRDYVDFYDDNGNFLVGSRDRYSDAVEDIVCVQNYDSYTSYEWDYELMYTPEFNAEHEVLLYGVSDGSKYFVKAVYLGTDAYEGHGLYDVLSKTLADYPSSKPVYVDWVQ
jgi:hypothetical protein